MNTRAAAETPPALRIWYAIFGAPLAWGVQEMLGWLLASGACPSGGIHPGAPIVSNSYTLQIIASIVALLIALGAFWYAIQAWRGSQDRGLAALHGRSRPDYLAGVALLVSFIFTLGVVWQSIAIFVLGPCKVMR